MFSYFPEFENHFEAGFSRIEVCDVLIHLAIAAGVATLPSISRSPLGKHQTSSLFE
jgi:hypothetical protein